MPFCQDLLRLLGVNVDFSPILSNCENNNVSPKLLNYLLTYLAGYTAKSDHHGIKLPVRVKEYLLAANDEDSAAKTIIRLLNQFSGERVINRSEAIHILMGLKMTMNSVKNFKNVNLSGCREIQARGDGEEVVKKTEFDKYVHRKTDANLTFHQYLSKDNSVPVLRSGMFHCPYPLTEAYAKTHLLLHHPPYSHKELSQIAPKEDWIAAYELFVKTSNCPPYLKRDYDESKLAHEKQNHPEKDHNHCPQDPLQPEDIHYEEEPMFSNPDDEETRKAFEEYAKENEDFDYINHNVECYDIDADAEPNYDDGGPDYDWSKPEYLPENGSDWLNGVMEDLKNSPMDKSIDTSLDFNLYSLNPDQKLVFQIVMRSALGLMHQDHPLRLLVNGVGGSGKSYLIKAIRLIYHFLFKDSSTIAVTAPTGTAAHLIDGSTIHRLLRIPVVKHQKNNPKEASGPQDEKAQKELENTRCMILDEISMVGCKLFTSADDRAKVLTRKGKFKNEPFGSLDMLLFGDFNQVQVCLLM